VRVPQLLAALSYGDAIGNEALAIQRQLRAAGHESDVFAELVHPGWPTSRGRSGSTAPSRRRRRSASTTSRSAAPPGASSTPPPTGWSSSTTTSRRPGSSSASTPTWPASVTTAGASSKPSPPRGAGPGRLRVQPQELEEAGFRRTAVLPIVLDLSLYDRPPSPVVRRRFDDGRVNVLFVGRVIPNKRIDDLIRSFAVFQRWLQPRSRLLLVGDYRGFERYLGRLRELVSELGAEEVVFAGHVDDDELYAFYRVADAFLCLSEHEGSACPCRRRCTSACPSSPTTRAPSGRRSAAGDLLQDKRPELVADLLDRVTRGGELRRAVLASQARAIASIRATDFGRC